MRRLGFITIAGKQVQTHADTLDGLVEALDWLDHRRDEIEAFKASWLDLFHAADEAGIPIRLLMEG